MATINLTDGNDTYTDGSGSDTVNALDGNDIVHGGDGDDTLNGGNGDDALFGDAGHNVLNGDDGNDALFSVGGIDTVDGGAGFNGWTADYSATSSDLVFDQTGSRAYTLSNGSSAQNIDRISITFGAGNDTANISALPAAGSVLLGGSGNNLLVADLSSNSSNISFSGSLLSSSSANLDTGGTFQTVDLTTGSGNDRITLPSTAVVVHFDGGSGSDAAEFDFGAATASFTFVLDSSPGATSTVEGQGSTLTNVETVTFFAGSGDDSLGGGSANDQLYGGAGNDTLQGGGGQDILQGGNGDDIIDGGSGGDSLDGGSGSNTVDYHDSPAGVTINLGSVKNGFVNGSGGDAQDDKLQHFESIIGSAFGDKLTGDAAANVLYGGAGNDSLDGGGGIDILYGGQGDDSFKVENTGDQVIENPGEGVDKVTSTVSFTLGANIENLILSGKAPIDGTGNELANHIAGNGAANILYGGTGNDKIDGGGGADTMYGGPGDDSFTVDNAGDQVIENPGEGTDKVSASVSFTLGPNVENLTLTGAANIDGAGNELANTITGNAGDNVLTGGAGADKLNGGNGDDTLIGGPGADKLTGGGGADTFVFGPANAPDADKITDFTHGTDHLAFHAGDYGLPVGALDPADLVFGKVATDAHAEFVYDATHKALYWDADGAGGAAAITVATFSTAVTLTAADFIILA